jgi:hypothetical protein
MARQISSKPGLKEGENKLTPTMTETFRAVKDIGSRGVKSMPPALSAAYPALTTLKNYEAHVEQQRAEAVAFVLGRRITNC